MRSRQGFTLVEVVVSMLIASVMIASVFSIAVTSKTTGVKSDRKLVAAEAARSIRQKLSNYICGDPYQTSIPGPSAKPGTSCTTASICSWSFNVTGFSDSQGSAASPVYALASGAHDVTGPGIVPPEITGSPYNGKVIYTVTWMRNGVQDNTCCCPSPIPPRCQPKIDVAVNWTEP